MTVTISVSVGGNSKVFVKHAAGGVDRAVVEVGPNQSVSFGAIPFVGDNILIIGPEIPAEVDHLAIQEQAKLDAAVGVADRDNRDESNRGGENAEKEQTWPTEDAAKQDDASAQANDEVVKSSEDAKTVKAAGSKKQQ